MSNERFQPGPVTIKTKRGKRLLWIEANGNVHRMVRSARLPHDGKLAMLARQAARERDSRIIRPVDGEGTVRPG